MIGFVSAEKVVLGFKVFVMYFTVFIYFATFCVGVGWDDIFS